MALKQRPAPRAATQAPPPRRRLRRRLLLIFVLGLFGFGLFLSVVYLFTKIPEPNQIATVQSTVVEDGRGQLIGRLHADEDRVIIPLAQIPPVMRDAVVAAEDRGFYHHNGLSLAGIARAAFTDLVSHRVREGGSTITQQYVKNAFVGNRRTLVRKVHEALIAVKLERTWNKQQILGAYLNTIYFGRGAYGIEAAARAYFGVPAAKLDLPKAALLAGVVRAPELLDPARHYEAAVKARKRVLDAMVITHAITQQQADSVESTGITTVSRSLGISGRAPHFLEAVRQELIRRFGEDAVYRGGLKVRTTLDLQMQQDAEAAVSGVLDLPTDPQAALVAVDPATGGVRALVGGRTYQSTQFDMATQALRQPGSSFKPFVLTELLEQGGTLDDRFRAPARISLDAGGVTWDVSNYDKHDYGMLTVLGATEESVNTVYAQMILRVGPQNIVDIAHKIGITAPLEPVASLALGTEEVTPFELAGAYATWANDGRHVGTHMIARVTDRTGHELYRFSDSAKQVVPQRVARTVTQALEGVMTSGTGRSAQIGRPAAGKTGTTENHRDAWFNGYTPDLATSVWMGFPDGKRTMQNVRGIQVVGASFPARIWKRFMNAALANVPAHDFPTPESAPAPSLSATPSASASALITGTVPAPVPSGDQGTQYSNPAPPPSQPPSETPKQTPTATPSQTQSTEPTSTPTSSPTPTHGRGTSTASPKPTPSG